MIIAGEIQIYTFDFLKGLNIPDCDIYLNERPDIMGQHEKRKRSYVSIGLPTGIEDKGCYNIATGVITIGTKDKRDTLGLIDATEQARIATFIKNAFPQITEDYSMIDFMFGSDDSSSIGWTEYYYTFQIFINHN